MSWRITLLWVCLGFLKVRFRFCVWGRIPHKYCILGLLWWVFLVLSVPLGGSGPNPISWSLSTSSLQGWQVPVSTCPQGRVCIPQDTCPSCPGMYPPVISYWVPLGCCSGNTKIRKSLLDSWWIYGYCPVLQPIPRAGGQRAKWGSGWRWDPHWWFVGHPSLLFCLPSLSSLPLSSESSWRDSPVHGTFSVPRVFTQCPRLK